MTDHLGGYEQSVDRVIFYMRKGFGEATRTAERFIERGDSDALRAYIHMFMETTAGPKCGHSKLLVEKPVDTHAAFLYL